MNRSAALQNSFDNATIAVSLNFYTGLVMLWPYEKAGTHALSANSGRLSCEGVGDGSIFSVGDFLSRDLKKPSSRSSNRNGQSVGADLIVWAGKLSSCCSVRDDGSMVNRAAMNNEQSIFVGLNDFMSLDSNSER